MSILSKRPETDIGLFLPSTVLARMETLDVAIRTLAGEIANSQVKGELRKRYADFFKSWKKFYSEHEGWIARSLNATYDTVEDYRNQYNSYRNAFLRAGGKTISGTFRSSKNGVLPLIFAACAGGIAAWWLGRKMG